jgi:hypothetical protein
MSSQIPSLGDKTDLRDIFRTLENQTSAIFNGDHDAHSASITTCLKKLAQLISSDKKKSEHSEDLKDFIDGGVCRVARNYGSDRETVTPIVLNFLMTAIRSYNHIKGSPIYHVELDTCSGLSDTGSAFLTQVLAPHIDAGARLFPVDTPLDFHIVVKEKVIIRTPSPPEGRKTASLSFGEALKALKTANKSPGKGSDTDSSGGGKTRRRRRRQRVSRRHSTRR